MPFPATAAVCIVQSGEALVSTRAQRQQCTFVPQRTQKQKRCATGRQSRRHILMQPSINRQRVWGMKVGKLDRGSAIQEEGVWFVWLRAASAPV